MIKVFDFYADAGHGWCKVSKQLLNELNIADKITHYSYQRNDYAYLEEDCDLSTFYNAYKDKYGIEPRFREHVSDTSKIRYYNHYVK